MEANPRLTTSKAMEIAAEVGTFYSELCEAKNLDAVANLSWVCTPDGSQAGDLLVIRDALAFYYDHLERVAGDEAAEAERLRFSASALI